MIELQYRLLNVFAEERLAGNALCVFEDGRGLSDDTMQALALQFNLSETTFVLPSDQATARVRIFTPTFEMPFAGHPTLGTAEVVRDLLDAGDEINLEMIAGIVPVAADGERWSLQAGSPSHRGAVASPAEVAVALGLAPVDIAGPVLWVNTGSEQLIVPLASVDAVRRAVPSREGLEHISRDGNRVLAYVFARDCDRVTSRFFFITHTSVVEDPGTGSACANLGGWLLATAAPLPQRLAIEQGDAVGRPCRLGLEVTSDRRIRVSGRVVELGRGTLRLD